MYEEAKIMPLKKGKTKEAIAYNIKELMKAGFGQKQAIAIALKKANKKKK